jgi:cobalt-zinc-cadmium efflux system outer membrane protein
MKRLVLALAVSTAAYAQGANSESLANLIAEALTRNPEILTAQKQYEAAQARRPVASSLADPTIAFSYMNANNPIPFTEIGRDPLSYAGISISQELPFNGKRKLRGEIAQKAAEEQLKSYEATRLAIVSRLKQAYYQVNYLSRAREIILRNKDLLEKFARIAEARYSVNKGSQTDVLKAQTEVTRMLIRVVKLDQEEAAVTAEINVLLNRKPETPLGPPADYPKAALNYSLEDLYAEGQRQSPVLSREQVEVDKTALALNLARRDYYPDFGIMGGYSNFGGYPSMFEGRVEVKVPLYFWRKQRYMVKEQAANVSGARYQYESTSQTLNLQIKDSYLAAKASGQLVELYSKGVSPQAALTLESSIASYETGTVDFLTLLSNFMAMLDSDLNYYEEFANYHKALARLEQLTGLHLTE